MKITRDNYEPLFVDFIDGKLDPAIIQALEAFLAQNPDLADELLDYQSMASNVLSPEPEAPTFPGKQVLFRNPFETEISKSFEHWAIAAMEGDLDSQRHEAFQAYLAAHPQATKEYNLFETTRLTADHRIRYPDKSSLKKGILPFFLRHRLTYSIAASFLLLAGFFFLFQSTETKTENQIAAVSIPKSIPSADSLKKDQPIPQKSLKPDIIKKRTPVQPGNKPSPKIKPQPSDRKPVPFQPVLSNPEKSMISDHLLAEQNIKPTNTNRDSLTFPHVLPGETQTTQTILADARPPVSQKISRTKALTIGQFAGKWFREKVLGKPELDNLSAWDIADAGAGKINQLTGSQIQIQKKQTEDGRTIAYNIGSPSFGISRKVSQ